MAKKTKIWKEKKIGGNSEDLSKMYQFFTIGSIFESTLIYLYH